MRINRSCIVVVGVAIAIVVVVAVAVIAYLMSKAPDVAQQVPPTPIIVTLKTPLNGSTVQVDSPVPVDAEALSNEAITALELWVDDTLMWTATSPSKASERRYLTFWSWTPTEEGYHTLVVRAVDQSGDTAQSNAVAVEVIPGEPPPSEQPAGVAEQPSGPETPAPSGPETPVPSGPETPAPSGPVAPPPPEREPAPPYSGPVSAPPTNPPNKGNFWVAGNLLPDPDPPAAPAITASVEGCSVNLFIQDRADDESGFFVYRYGPIATDFGRIATLGIYDGAQPFQYTDADLFGKFVYYVAAFNPGGESISNLYSVTVDDPACLTDKWTSLGLSGGQITTTEPVERLYCYLSVDNGPWTRMPTGPQTFLHPDQDGVFDVSTYLDALASPPPPDGVTLALDCWGWTDGTLLYLGAARQDIPAQDNEPVQFNTNLLQFIGQTHVGALHLLGKGGPPVPLWISRPFNLQATQDPNVASERRGPSAGWVGVMRNAIAQKGYYGLVWDWPAYRGLVCLQSEHPDVPCPIISNEYIEGFRLYEVSSPLDDKFGYEFDARLLVQLGNPEITLFAINPAGWPKRPSPDGSSNPHCYVVRAYGHHPEHGEVESADSNRVCLEPTVAGIHAKTVDFEPEHIGTIIGHWQHVPDDDGGWLDEAATFVVTGIPPAPPVLDVWGKLYLAPEQPPPGQFIAGYELINLEDRCARNVYHGAVHFDISEIGQRPVQDATLYYLPGPTRSFWPGITPDEVSQTSCVSQVLLANTSWWSEGQTFESVAPTLTVYRDLEPSFDIHTTQIPLDVLSVVTFWRDNPDMNFGFVFRNEGPVQTIEGYEEACWTRYSELLLKVTYLSSD